MIARGMRVDLPTRRRRRHDARRAHAHRHRRPLAQRRGRRPGSASIPTPCSPIRPGAAALSDAPGRTEGAPYRTSTRTGGQILVDHWSRRASSTSSACPARAISPCSTRCTTATSHVTVCRQEGGAAMMADAVGPADRAAGHLLRHARAGRHQRRARHPYRPARFDAADPVRRPGRARHARTAARCRRWTTAPCSAR